MSLFTGNAALLRSRSLALVSVLALAACGDDGAPGGNGAGPEGGANSGGNGQGGTPQGGEASGGNSQGGSAQGGAPTGGSAEGGSTQGGSAQGGAPTGGSAEGGAGQGGGSATPSITDLCTTACNYFADCFKGSPTKCITECSADLGDCSAAQLDEVDACNQAAMGDCGLTNAFETCLQSIACITGV